VVVESFLGSVVVVCSVEGGSSLQWLLLAGAPADGGSGKFSELGEDLELIEETGEDAASFMVKRACTQYGWLMNYFKSFLMLVLQID
jgi:hypothetical protein